MWFSIDGEYDMQGKIKKNWKFYSNQSRKREMRMKMKIYSNNNNFLNENNPVSVKNYTAIDYVWYFMHEQ